MTREDKLEESAKSDEDLALCVILVVIVMVL